MIIKRFFSAIILVAIFIFNLPLSVLAETINSENDNQYIVPAVIKIKTFVKDSFGDINYYSSGSGIIISADGLVLTNHHVVYEKHEFDGSKLDLGLIGCMVIDENKEPDCDYPLGLVASDEKLDVAVLKIVGNRTNLPFLNLNRTKTVNSGDKVVAIGFPEIGGISATVSSGIISGLIEKYGRSWIKTDANVSFGSSGGAILDEEGDVVGLTTASAGTMGYAINLTSLAQWLDENKLKQPVVSALNDQAQDFLKIKETINNDNTFRFSKPIIYVTKPSDWQFFYQSAGFISAVSEYDDAYVNISIRRVARPLSEKEIINYVKFLDKSGCFSLGDIEKDGVLKIGNRIAREVECSLLGKNKERYLVMSVANYLVIIQTDAGEDDVYKSQVEEILSSIVVEGGQRGDEQKSYKHEKLFNVKANSDWAVAGYSSKEEPIEIFSKKYQNVFAKFTIKKVDDKNMTNKKILENELKIIKTANAMANLLDIDVKTYNSYAEYSISKKMPKFVKYDFELQENKKNKGGQYGVTYIIKKDKYLIEFDLLVYNKNSREFQKIKKDFEKYLTTIEL